MRLLLTFVLLIHSSEWAFAIERTALSCIELVADPREPLQSPPNPSRLLPALGLERRLETFVKGLGTAIGISRWSRASSPQGEILRNFLRRWPRFQFYYREANTWKMSPEIRVVLYDFDRPVGFIPLITLANEELLRSHLQNIDAALQKMRILRQENVRFQVLEFTSSGFHLVINYIPETTQLPALRWLRHRMLRHRLHFFFADETNSDYLKNNVSGVSVGDYIYLTNNALLDETRQSARVLVHEVVHGMNAHQLSLGKHPEKMIMYDAGELNESGLLGSPESFYNRYFRSDEVEAWSVYERMDGTPSDQSMVPSFLENQILWMTEVKGLLDSFEEKELAEKFRLGEIWEPDFFGISISYSGKSQYDLFAKQHRYRSIYLWQGTEQSVNVMIPLVHSRVAEVGELNYLKEVIDERLRQLLNIRQARELREQRLTREAQEARENTLIRWWMRRLFPPQ